MIKTQVSTAAKSKFLRGAFGGSSAELAKSVDTNKSTGTVASGARKLLRQSCYRSRQRDKSQRLALVGRFIVEAWEKMVEAKGGDCERRVNSNS